MDIRNEIIEALKREINGPAPHPEYIDDETHEEILLNFVHGSPITRYGSGMLYPQNSLHMDVEEEGSENKSNSFDLKKTR
jgi:hypothetical protein